MNNQSISEADSVLEFGLLASYLVTQTKTDVKTVQSMLRHADIGTTLDIYTHAINQDKLVAQNQVMEAMLKPGLVNCGAGKYRLENFWRLSRGA